MIALNIQFDARSKNEIRANLGALTIYNQTAIQPIRITGLSDGMQSGRPSVAFRFYVAGNTHVVAETSLSLFLMAADGFKAKYSDPLQLEINNEPLPYKPLPLSAFSKINIDMEGGEGEGVWSDLFGQVVVHSKTVPMKLSSIETPGQEPSIVLSVFMGPRTWLMAETSLTQLLDAAAELRRIFGDPLEDVK